MPHQDRGKRGMGPLLQSGELEEMVRSVREAQSVAILTGYPCCLHDPPTETDGPLGAIAMARAISALGIRTVILTDECNEAPVSAALKASLRAYPPSSPSRQACVVKAFPGGTLLPLQAFGIRRIISRRLPGFFCVQVGTWMRRR